MTNKTDISLRGEIRTPADIEDIYLVFPSHCIHCFMHVFFFNLLFTVIDCVCVDLGGCFLLRFVIVYSLCCKFQGGKKTASCLQIHSFPGNRNVEIKMVLSTIFLSLIISLTQRNDWFCFHISSLIKLLILKKTCSLAPEVGWGTQRLVILQPVALLC